MTPSFLLPFVPSIKVMRALERLFVLAAALAISGCTTIQRWSNDPDLPPHSPPQFNVTSAPAATADGGLTAKDLSDRAGAAYITALAGRDKSAADLRSDIAKPMKSPPSGISDGTVVARVVLVTVERPFIRPGDRLLMTRVRIYPSDKAKVSFTGYKFATTERATINIGTVTASNSLSGTAGIGAGPAASAGTLPSLSITPSRTQTATRTINQEAIFSVSAQPDRLEIYKTGAEDRDLLGNTLINLSVKLGNINDAPVYYIVDTTVIDDQTGAPLAAAKVNINLDPAALFEPQNIWVCAAMDYEDRQVDNPRSADEGRQKVTISAVNGHATPYKLIPYQDLQQPVWQIFDAHGSPLAFSDALTSRKLSFDDYDGAEQFLGWLKKTKAAAIKNGQLVIATGGSRFEPIQNYGLLTVRLASQTIGADTPPPACP